MLHRLCLLSMILVTSPAWGSSITEITLGIVLDGSGYPGGWVAPQVDGASGLNVAAAGDSTYSLLDVGSGIPDGNYLLIVGSQYGDFWFGPSGTLSVVIQYSDSSQREESFSYGGAAVLSSSLDMRVGCEGTKFRFLAAAYGRINSTWTLPNQVGWPMAKELLFSARVVEAEEAYRIGLLNHLVPRAELRTKTMWLAKMIAANHHGAVTGIKSLLLHQLGEGLEAQWAAERDYTTNVMRGAKAEDAFPEFIARKGRS